MSSNKKNMARNDGQPALTPKLRFPEFRNAAGFQVTKLNALLFEAKHRNRTLDLGRADVLSVSGEHGCINQIEFMGRSYAGVTVKDYHVVEHGDIVYTKSPLKKNPYGIIKANKGKRGIVSTLYAVYRPFPDCSATYLDHFFSVDHNLNTYLQPIVKKGAKNDMKVNNADVLKGDICVPKLNEQQKIADCLDSVDELIAAQARKVDALKTYKKGLMQQLFPREGETESRLRFPEFQNDGEWAVKSIGDLKPFVTSGSRGWAAFYANQGDLFVRMTNLWRDSIYLDLTDSKFVQLPAGVNEGIRTQLKEHDVLISITADIGIIGYVDKRVPEPAYINQHIALLRFDQSQLSGKYVAYFLASERSQRLFRASTDTGTKAGMSLTGIQEIEVMLPSLTEQRRIADCLTSLDNLINAQIQKYDALKTHKKGLMQQLFPSLGKSL